MSNFLSSRCYAEILKEDLGSGLTELALMLPFLVVLLIGAVDFGKAWYLKLEVSSAAEAGALYGVQYPSDTAGMSAAASLEAPDIANLSSAATYGNECSDGTSIVPLATSVPSCSSNSVGYVEVDTTTVYKPLLAYPGFASSFTLLGKSRMRTSF